MSAAPQHAAVPGLPALPRGATRGLYAYDRFVMFDVTTVGEFSCHMAAVAALIRLHNPEFRRLGSTDTREDMDLEPAFREAVIAITSDVPEPVQPHGWSAQEERDFQEKSAHVYEREVQAKAARAAS